jgi:signal transduction histidine kinase/AmiR/NasT family two-component response regulator
MNAEARAALAESLTARVEQFGMRFVISVGITLILLPTLGWKALAWLGLWIGLQNVEKTWTSRHLAAGTLTQVAPFGLVLIVLNGVWFSAVALAAMLTRQEGAGAIGMIVLAGALMNTGPSTRRSAAAFAATLAPVVPYVAAVPALAWMRGAALVEICSLAGACVLLVGTAFQLRKFSVRALEGERRANAAKSEFLATVSHEIRTPLNGVLGMAQVMAAGELSEPQRRRLDTLRQSGETLLLLLNDILDLSKIEAGKLDLEDADFDLEPLCRSIHAAFAPVAAGKSLGLHLEIADSALGVYRGDSARLRQILFNLLSNAVKFTERGEVRVSVSRGGRDLCVAVADTGIGIPADRIARLFGKFEQADASTTRRFGGSGLGLAICNTLTGLMGGTIEVESREGRGSTFRMLLPLARIGEAKVPVAGDAPSRPSPRQTGVRVLAAEDNTVNQLVLRALLEQADADLTIVGDGAEAVEAWRAGEWDVILMDVQMPVMDGPAATRAIRAAEAETGRSATPIVALTANAMAHQIAEYADAGMDAFVAKPIKVEELFAAIETAMEHPRQAVPLVAQTGRAATPRTR